MPNAHAQLLARSQRSAVGVIVHDVSDPYFAEITRGLQRVATEHGRLRDHLQQLPRPGRASWSTSSCCAAQQVAAIILAGSGYHDAAFTKAARRASSRAYQAHRRPGRR